MLAQVPGQADHVLGHQAADGAAGVHGYDRLARHAWPGGRASQAAMVAIT
jgi:hypothetical protein